MVSELSTFRFNKRCWYPLKGVDKRNLRSAKCWNYSSAMCRVLQVNRSTYYYETKQKPDESGLASEITEIFRASRNNYGTRKIKKELMDTGKQVSRRRIGRIMKREGLISNYTTAQFKPQKNTCSESWSGKDWFPITQPHNLNHRKTPVANHEAGRIDFQLHNRTI